MLLPRLCLPEVNFRDSHDVVPLLRELHELAFPGVDSSYVERSVADVESMFRGDHPDYQAMDTAYHDIEHTLQATLCWARLVCNRHLLGAAPRIDPRLFKIGLLAVLMHDIGYLKERGDNIGTGAKYTFVHERRSCELALLYLMEQQWPIRDIFMVQHLISCTGPLARVDAIPFYGLKDRMLGQALCAADYLGQMSDPRYVEKLPDLYKEFVESDDYRGVPLQKRLYNSYEQLLRQTPAFWENVVRDKLENECAGLHRFLADPHPDGPNPYIEAIEANMVLVRERTDATVANG